MSDLGGKPHGIEGSAYGGKANERSGRRVGAELETEARRAAGAVGEEAEAVTDRARRRASDSLSSLADSVRRASDDYRASQPGLLADLMGHAADGVESLARTTGGQSSTDLIGSAREFGRRNPLGLLLGGLAAGFAISRLASAPDRSTTSGGDAGSWNARPEPAAGIREGDNRHDS